MRLYNNNCRDNCTNRPQNTGFTLIEVLVALAIIAIAFLAVVKSAGQNIGHAAYLKEKTLAHWVAMNRVTEMQVSDEFPDRGESWDTATMANREWQLKTEVDDTADKDMHRITLSVHPDRDQPALVSLTTYLGRP